MLKYDEFVLVTQSSFITKLAGQNMTAFQQNTYVNVKLPDTAVAGIIV
jgi:hypothetical protein